MDVTDTQSGQFARDVSSRSPGQLMPLHQPPSAQADTDAVVVRHERIAFLDVAKGLGILLVVMGHCMGGIHDAGIVADSSLAWFGFYLIYGFHMPYFFFLSGSLVEARVRTKPWRFLQSTVTRIAYPYFLWGAIQTLVLLMAANLINHPVQEPIGTALLRIFWVPPAQFWFLYVLFFLHLAAFLAISVGGRVVLALAAGTLYAACLFLPSFEATITHYINGEAVLFLLAYVAGVCFGGSVVSWRGQIEQPYLWSLLGFIVLFASAWRSWSDGADWYSYAMLPGAFAGCAATLVLARSDAFCRNRWLAYLGRRSMPIYLLHVLFVAGTRIALVKAGHISSVIVILPVIFLVGVVGPLLVHWVARVCRIQLATGLG